MEFNYLAVKRYSDAYQAPRLMLTAGKGVKGIGVSISLLVFLVGIGNSDRGMDTFVIFIISFFLGLLTFGLGMIISNQGQILQSSLDTAVNTSPFLSAQERADVMSLAPQRSWDAIGMNSISPANAQGNGTEKTTAPQLPKFQDLTPIESPIAALIAEAQMVEAARSPRPVRRPSRFSSRRWY